VVPFRFNDAIYCATPHRFLLSSCTEGNNIMLSKTVFTSHKQAPNDCVAVVMMVMGHEDNLLSLVVEPSL